MNIHINKNFIIAINISKGSSEMFTNNNIKSTKGQTCGSIPLYHGVVHTADTRMQVVYYSCGMSAVAQLAGPLGLTMLDTLLPASIKLSELSWHYSYLGTAQFDSLINILDILPTWKSTNLCQTVLTKKICIWIAFKVKITLH